jgi:hypothetical protein
MRDKIQGELRRCRLYFRVAKIFPCPFQQWPKLTDVPVRGTAYGFGYQLQYFRVEKIWALRSPVGWSWRSWLVDRQGAWTGTEGGTGRALSMSAIFSRRENHPLPYPFQQCPKLTAAPVRGTAYGFGYQRHDFRVAKIWALRSLVGAVRLPVG